MKIYTKKPHCLFLFVVFIVSFIPGAVSATHFPIIENSTVSSISINDFSFSHDGTGSNLLAVVLVSQRYGAPGGIETVTYGGQEMKLAQSTGYGLAYVYYLENPPPGQQIVTVDVLNAAYLANRPVLATALTITGADLVNPIDSVAEYSGEFDNTIDAAINLIKDKALILNVLGTTSGTDPSPIGAGHISLRDGLYNFGIYGFGYKEAENAGTHTLGWATTNQGNDFGLAIVAIASVAHTLEKPYPLYTQIISPYPSIEETTEWADDEYAGGSAADSCGETIAECGCAITSLVMSARNAGIEEDVLEGDVNPGNMNSYLESVSGYTSYGALRWLAAQAYFGQFTSAGTIATRFGAPSRPLSEVDAMAHIDAALAEGDKAVLGYKNGHFVWVPEKTVDSYIVNDPWWFNTKTADDDTAEKVKDYNNVFTDARVLAISTEPVELSGSDIEVHLQGTAELLFKNAAGEVGYTPEGVVIDLEKASYGDTEVISVEGAVGDSSGKHLLVYEAGYVFTVDVIGTGFGEYEMEFFTISETGEVTTFSFSGVTIPGVTTTWSFDLETGVATEQEITYEQFLIILDIQMEGYSEQQKKFFLKWAEKMFNDREQKTVSQALQSIETFGKLIGAKKIESPVLVSVLDLLEGSLSGGKN